MIPEIIKILESNNTALVQAVGGIQLIKEDWLLKSKRNMIPNSKAIKQNKKLNLAKRCFDENY